MDERKTKALALEDERRARWDPRQRFRLYAVRAGGHPSDRVEVLATPTYEGIGPMLRLMREEGEISSSDRTAVLDTAPWEQGHAGDWIVGSLG